jgi:hypothetical protein
MTISHISFYQKLGELASKFTAEFVWSVRTLLSNGAPIGHEGGEGYLLREIRLPA